MKRYVKTLLLFCTVSIIPLPFYASSNYAISELGEEGEHKSDPLDIFSEHKHQKYTLRQKDVEKIKIESVQIVSPKSYHIDREHTKIVYLTFDDGPLKGTENVIRILKEEGIEATMFFIGKHINKHPLRYSQALSMPNLLIANHTYSHANGKYAHFYSSTEEVVKDVDKAQQIIGGVKYLRLAGRNVWRMPLVNRDDYALPAKRRIREHAKYEALSSRGYQIFGWDIEWNFVSKTGRPAYGADQMASRIENLYNSGRTAKSGKVILLAHDYMFRGQNASYALRELIEILRSNGWSFATIDDYSSTTPDVYLGKNHTRTASPFDLLQDKYTSILNEMNTESFASLDIKKYLQHPKSSTEILPAVSKSDTIQIVLSKKEDLTTEQKSVQRAQ